MKRWLFILCLILTVVPVTAQDKPEPPNFRPAAFEREMESALQANNLDGVMVLLMDKGEVVYLDGIGTNAAGQPFDLEESYPIGRLADMFIATSILMLQERGWVEVEDFASNSLPELTADPLTSILLRQLLNHSAGLGTAETALIEKITPTAELAEHSQFFPGSRFSYCTRCYGLLIHLTEMLNGKPFDELLHDTMFYPLHMDNTRLEEGQLITTLPDMAHWLGMLLQNGRWESVQLIQPQTIREMQKATIPTNRNQNEHAGYGWLVQKNLGLGVRDPLDDQLATVLDFGEYRAQMTTLPYFQRGVLLLTDQPTAGLESLMAVAVKHFLGWQPPEFEKITGLRGYTGVFRTPTNEEIILREQGDGLEIEIQGQTAPLTQVDVRQFVYVLDGKRGNVYFDLNAQGSVFTLSIAGISQVFTRFA